MSYLMSDIGPSVPAKLTDYGNYGPMPLVQPLTAPPGAVQFVSINPNRGSSQTCTGRLRRRSIPHQTRNTAYQNNRTIGKGMAGYAMAHNSKQSSRASMDRGRWLKVICKRRSNYHTLRKFRRYELFWSPQSNALLSSDSTARVLRLYAFPSFLFFVITLFSACFTDLC